VGSNLGMSTDDATALARAVERLREEISRLSKLHEKSLSKAAFGGMTPAETKEYDERLERLAAMNRELASLEQRRRTTP
jgi:hypothetical protein